MAGASFVMARKKSRGSARGEKEGRPPLPLAWPEKKLVAPVTQAACVTFRWDCPLPPPSPFLPPPPLSIKAVPVEDLII